MRRAIIATIGTVVALVAVLDYKSHGAVNDAQVVVPSTSSASSTTSPSAAADGKYAGTAVQYQYGEIEVTITVDDGKITGLSLPLNTSPDPESASINSQAVPILTKEALAAQGVDFDAVGGATYTSNAFAQAFESALGKAGK